jgi:hypothetical protein
MPKREREPEIPPERFVNDVDWPGPRKLDREPSHPERIPDDEPGPFRERFWERVEDEIGYEGER